MKLSAPKNLTWWIAVILGVLGLLGTLFTAGLSSLWVWLLLLGFALLAVATMVDGL
jgi:hypothetical protein